MQGLLLHSDAITALFLFLSASQAPLVPIVHLPSSASKSFLWYLLPALSPLSLLSSAFIMMSQPWQYQALDLTAGTGQPHSLTNGYTHHHSWSANITGLKTSGCLKFFLFPNVMAILSWIVSLQNSCAPRLTACELIWKWGLYRCNKLNEVTRP